GPGPADPVGRADRPFSVCRHPRGPRKRKLLLRRDRRCACSRSAEKPGRSSYLRQAQHPEKPPHGRCTRARRERGRSGRSCARCSRSPPHSLRRVKELQMTRTSIFILLGCAALGACNNNQAQQEPNKIRVTSQEQEQLHQLDAFNLAIGLKRAIYDAGYSCKRITDAGFVGTWKNLDEWT